MLNLKFHHFPQPASITHVFESPAECWKCTSNKLNLKSWFLLQYSILLYCSFYRKFSFHNKFEQKLIFQLTKNVDVYEKAENWKGFKILFGETKLVSIIQLYIQNVKSRHCFDSKYAFWNTLVAAFLCSNFISLLKLRADFSQIQQKAIHRILELKLTLIFLTSECNQFLSLLTICSDFFSLLALLLSQPRIFFEYTVWILMPTSILKWASLNVWGQLQCQHPVKIEIYLNQ